MSRGGGGRGLPFRVSTPSLSLCLSLALVRGSEEGCTGGCFGRTETYLHSRMCTHTWTRTRPCTHAHKKAHQRIRAHARSSMTPAHRCSRAHARACAAHNRCTSSASLRTGGPRHLPFTPPRPPTPPALAAAQVPIVRGGKMGGGRRCRRLR